LATQQLGDALTTPVELNEQANWLINCTERGKAFHCPYLITWNLECGEQEPLVGRGLPTIESLRSQVLGRTPLGE